MAERASSGGQISVRQAAALLLISEQWVRDLAKKLWLVGAVHCYIRWLKDEERRTSKTAARLESALSSRWLETASLGRGRFLSQL